MLRFITTSLFAISWTHPGVCLSLLLKRPSTEPRILCEPDRGRTGTNTTFSSCFSLPRPIAAQSPLAAFPFLNHCLCVSGALELVAWVPCLAFTPFHRHVEICLLGLLLSTEPWQPLTQPLGKSWLGTTYLLPRPSLLVWKPLPSAGNGSSFQPGFVGQGFGPWPHYPVRLVLRLGWSRASCWDLPRVAGEGRAGQGWGKVKVGQVELGRAGLHGKQTGFSKSVEPGDGRAGRWQRCLLPMAMEGVDLNKSQSCLTSWETLGKPHIPSQGMTLASNAKCYHLSSTDSGTVQLVASSSCDYSSKLRRKGLSLCSLYRIIDSNSGRLCKLPKITVFVSSWTEIWTQGSEGLCS